ncbi:MAG TPA: [LysW]-lysine hydrolase [Chloroflexi bacterium]|nr:[LysW]-lysine hydrolase [Chloroflexota bacterium]
MDDIGFLEELISIPSLSGHEDALARYLTARMEELGFRAYIDPVGNAVGVIGGRDARRTVVLIGHMDTVPGVVPIERRGHLLFGRGTVDAKGPLATLVLAAARAASSLKETQLVVVGTVEEEATCRGARYLLDSMDPPTNAIVGEPSGWEGITIGYKGVLGVEYLLDQAAGHGANGQPTPAEQAVVFWNRLRSLTDAHNAGITRRFDALDPALDSVCTSSDGLLDRVTMSISCRTPPGFETTGLWREMLAWAPPASLRMRSQEAAVEGDKNNELVRALLRAIRAEGGSPRFKLKTGTSDMNVLYPAWGCPMVAYGPGESSLDHTPEEHLDLEQFRRGVSVLTRALEVLCAQAVRRRHGRGRLCSAPE